MQTLTINEGWQFRQANKNEWLPAVVPGCVHLDLRRHNKIPELFYRFNEKEVQWIENEDWEYQTSFEAGEKLLNRENIDLLFKGLDTYADIYLNDSLLLSANNMHRSWSADCKKLLKQGKNSLRIYFHSPVKIGLKKLEAVPYTLPGNNEQAVKRTGLFTRKAPYHYGWDWGPRLVTSGIWRPVMIKAWDAAKIEDVFVEQKNVSKDKASCLAQVEVKSSGENEVKL
ncbi:MAG: hypothetical protein K2X86_00070, partial [Cytophagaceae bacterium]|nr:hypothetical protein [Cytophagaceae bacterium]